MENNADKNVSEDKESDPSSENNLTCEQQETANEFAKKSTTCEAKCDESVEPQNQESAVVLLVEQKNEDVLLEEKKADPIQVIDHIIIRAEQVNSTKARECHENIETDGSATLDKDTPEDIKITHTKESSVSVNTEATSAEEHKVVAEIYNQHEEILEVCSAETKANNEPINIEESDKQTNKEDHIEAQPKESLNIITPNQNDMMDVESSVNDYPTASTKETPMQINTVNVTESHRDILLQENNAESTIVSLESVPKNVPSAGLSMLAQYNSDRDSDNDSISDTNSIVEVPTSTSIYRNRVVEITSDSDTDSSSDSGSVECLNEIRETIEKSIELDDEDDDEWGGKTQKQPPRVKGEFLIDDLPPIEDLHITVPEEECIELGKVHSVVDQLLLVSALPNSILLDLETVLFLDKGKRVLGEVFDVLGPVSDPLYCVRFNSNQQIKEKNIQLGDVVFVAPKTEYTQFVILSSLMKARGSDASWENDVEPPPRFLAYSDDEQERAARAKLRGQNRPNDHNDPTKRSRSELESPSPTPEPLALPSSAPRQRFNQFRERGAGVGRGGRGGRGNFRSPRYDSNSTQDYQHAGYNRGSWHSNYPQRYAPPQTHNWQGQQFTYSQQPNFAPYRGHAQTPMHNYQPPASLPNLRQPPPAQSPTPPLYVVNPYAVRPPILPPSNQHFQSYASTRHPPPPPGAE